MREFLHRPDTNSASHSSNNTFQQGKTTGHTLQKKEQNKEDESLDFSETKSDNLSFDQPDSPVQKRTREDDETLQGKFETIVQRLAMPEPARFVSFKGKNGTDNSVQRKEEKERIKLPHSEKENNSGLPANLQSGIENLSGYKMDDVKVHYNSPRPIQLQAHAYTQGTDIHVSGGQEKHLPHEAWHVVQQKQGRVTPTMQLKEKINVNDDKGLEKEADEMGTKAMQLKVNSSPNNVIESNGKGHTSTTIQLKGEFKAAFQKNPEVAKAAVKADYGNYASYQDTFEKKLGIGLHGNDKAMAGVDTMLLKMKNAMLAAGFNHDEIKKAFAIGKASADVDLGGVLLNDVDEALQSGNLREKMGMVYQARFQISKALDILRDMKNSPVPLGPELRSAEMADDINAKKLEKKDVSYAILNRRKSVSEQPRSGNKDKKQKLITEDLLKEMGVPLSEREERAAEKQGRDQKRMFIPGSEFYRVNDDKIKSDQEQLRRVVAGLSGSTDMYFNIAKHLNMNEGERKGLRLAALGQMMVNNDHSYHEIMHVAKTQGGLSDYADELPIGYTSLAPLSYEEITGTAGLPDFPGDEQVLKSEETLATSAEVKQQGGNPAKRSNKYQAIINKVDQYHINPGTKKLNEIMNLVDVWMDAKKPGKHAFAGTKRNWEADARRKELVKLKEQAARLINNEQMYLNLDLRSAKLYILDQVEKAPDDKKDAAKNKMLNFIKAYIDKITEDANLGLGLNPDDPGAKILAQQIQELKDVETYIKTSNVPGQGHNLLSKDFRAPKSDLNMDLSEVKINETGVLERYADIETPSKGNLDQLLKDGVIESRKIIKGLGGDVSNIPDLEKKPEYGSPLQQRLGEKSKKDELRDEIQLKYTKEQDDFVNNLDTSMMEALKPRTPLENLLRQIEGKPMPQELQALQAYAQPGFYKIMNGILNNMRNPEFIAQVPEDAMALVRLAISGLRKMKPYTGGSAYRGEPGVRSKDVIENSFLPKDQREIIWESMFNRPMTYSQFVSTSKRAQSSYITTKNKWKAIEIRNIKTGVDISAISNTFYEREVLFPPGTKFNVISVEDRFVTQEKSKDDKVIQTDVANKYDEATIGSDQLGRVKVVMEEV